MACLGRGVPGSGRGGLLVVCLLCGAVWRTWAWTPVMDLAFEEGRGQWVLDASASENHAVLGTNEQEETRDPAWGQAPTGHALTFDGHDDVVTVPHTLSLVPAAGLRVAVWFMQTGRTPFARLVDKGSGFDVYIDDRGFGSFRFHGAEAFGIRTDCAVPLNQWCHLMGQHDGRTLSIWLNGECVGRRPFSGPLPSQPMQTGEPVRIGNGHAARPFCGRISRVAIWNSGYEPLPVSPLTADADTVGLWSLDGLTSGLDRGPLSLVCEVRGATECAGRVAGALSFAGDDCVRVRHHSGMDLRDELAIECWVKQTERRPYARILEKSEWVYALWVRSDGRVDFVFKNDDEATTHTITDSVIPLQRWVHLRAEFDGFEALVYIDGVVVGRSRVPEQKRRITRSDGDLFIGNREAGDRGFVGAIDDVRLSRIVRRPRPPVHVWVTPAPLDETWDIWTEVRGSRGKVTMARGALIDPADGRTLRTWTLSEFDYGRGCQTIDVRDVLPGEYRIEVVGLAVDGAEVARATHDITRPGPPAWSGGATGVTNEVLPPWTPMGVSSEASGHAVTCWGRVYGFEKSFLPARIESLGGELLAGPARLVVIGDDGRRLPVVEECRVAESADHAVTLRGKITIGSGSARLRATSLTTIEYDGMLRTDLELDPGESWERIGEIVLEIPLKPATATLMTHPGRWFDDPTCAGKVPEGGWGVPDSWYLWVGGEHRGLCWFAEDQAEWELSDGSHGLSLTPGDGEVLLRVRLRNGPSDRRSFTWGLMATPVKPLPKGWQTLRFGGPHTPADIHVLWSTVRSSQWHSFPLPVDDTWYRDQVARAHAAGRRFVPYTNFNMQSDIGEDWEYWGETWSACAGEGKAADVLAMNVVNVRCCAALPAWCDFITWTYKEFIDSFDSDGFYLDNSVPHVCRNERHPSEHHNRRHIFAARELMKRFYAITKQNDPNNVMVCHMSSRPCLPLLSFCDAIVDGEQYGYLLDERFDGHYMPVTPLDRVRAELMAWGWGLVPFYLPCNRGPNPWDENLMRELMGLLLPHGVRFWMSGHPKTLGR
ncbi:MAG: LamG domain-containing protein, partial [Lentisphaerae bacterium]|nr:LamG domain-containing protein [Lentisphaerota bacterium]